MENVGAGDLSLPQNEMHTTAYWVTVPADLLQVLPFTPEQKINGLYGLSYIMHHVAPLFLMCDIHDIGVSLGDNSTGESIPPKDLRAKIQPRPGRRSTPTPDFEPNIFIYDNYPGRDRPQPVALRPRQDAPRLLPQDDPGLPLPRRLPLLRRADQGERRAGQGQSGRSDLDPPAPRLLEIENPAGTPSRIVRIFDEPAVPVLPI